MRIIKNEAEFKAITESGKPVLVDFSAEWCGPCRAIQPTLERLSEKHGDDFLIVKVDVDDSPELAMRFEVRSIPTLVFLQDGETVERLTGVQTEAALEKRIQTYSVAI